MIFKIIRFTENLFLTHSEHQIKNTKLNTLLAAVREFSDKLHLFIPINPLSEELTSYDLH